MKDDRGRLLHILDAIERIEKYAAPGEHAFRKDPLIQTWMIHHIQVIGEASRALPLPFRDSHPQVPWSKIIGMRHVLVHDYFGVELDIVWRVVSTDIPDLKGKIQAIVQGL